MGSPDFAVPALMALHRAKHEIQAVYCQPPKPAHRGQRETKCAVHLAAETIGLTVRTPRRLRGNADEAVYFASLRLDAAVVAAYGLILPPECLAAPVRGCLNIHASLLPRWRGAAPIQAAILAGDAATGVTIMQMDAGLDTGPMLLSEATPITASDTASTVHDRLQNIGAKLILRALAENPIPRPQPADSTYAPKLSRADALIDWRRPATELDRKIRAYTPWPGTETTLSGGALKILQAVPMQEGPPSQPPPGVALDDRLTIACGEGALRLLRVQKAGRAALDADDFLRGTKIPAGTRLG